MNSKSNRQNGDIHTWIGLFQAHHFHPIRRCVTRIVNIVGCKKPQYNGSQVT